MRQLSQKQEQTFDFIEVNGTGTVATSKGYRDVFVHGYFKWNRWAFIVHQDVQYPELLTVSEASSGFRLRDERYYSVEDALHFALPFMEEKRYYFSTSVGDALVQSRTDLSNRNTTGLQTLGVDTLLWL